MVCNENTIIFTNNQHVQSMQRGREKGWIAGKQRVRQTACPSELVVQRTGGKNRTGRLPYASSSESANCSVHRLGPAQQNYTPDRSINSTRLKSLNTVSYFGQPDGLKYTLIEKECKYVKFEKPVNFSSRTEPR